MFVQNWLVLVPPHFVTQMISLALLNVLYTGVGFKCGRIRYRPVGWFGGTERVFVGWKVHLSNSALYLQEYT